MKLKIVDAKKIEKGSRDLPSQFSEEIRPDLIKRAVHAVQANSRQKYGAKPEAGMRASADISRRRHDYKGSYGHGISRVPRKIMTGRGTRFHWVGAVAPGTVGGRRAHAPKADKQWDKKMNKKERRKAIRSAISATVISQLVEKRGHKIPQGYPFIIDESAEKITKTDEAKEMLKLLGLNDELIRCEVKKIRAGKGKMRGRKYNKKVGPLVVVSGPCELQKAARNIPGVEVRSVSRLNAELLAPGTDYGRLTLWTKAAIEKMEKESLFN
jgi:large subunit ribosomal protein L4e